MEKRSLFAAIIALMLAQGAYAFHPLNTDDTGTMGKGNCKSMLTGKYEHNEEAGMVEAVSKIKASVTVGAAGNIDIEVGQPYKFKKEDDNGAATKTNGIADTEVEMKWRFYERGTFSLAVRPSLTLATGSEDKGLGAGKATYGLFLLATKQLEQWAFHVNAGYERLTDEGDERPDIWHYSSAAEYEAGKGFVLIGEAGIHSNEDQTSLIHPVYTTLGLLYKPAMNIKLGLGLRLPLNRAEPDYTLLTGITVYF